MSIEVRQLRYAVITSDTQSFSRAAAVLNFEHFGLVTVLCWSPISLCHVGLECERADAAQIWMTSSGVVEPVDVLEDGCLGLLPC